MQRYLLGRLASSALSLLGLSLIIFVLMRVVPGDAAAVALGPDAASSPQQLREYRHRVGLDRPLPVQYLTWLSDLGQGRLGKSVVTGRSVASELRGRISTTGELAIFALVFSMVAGVLTGTLAAVKRGGIIDQLVRVVTVLGLAVPSFWLGTLVIVYGAILFHWFPPIGQVDLWKDPGKNLQQMLIPSIIVGAALAASLSRLSRSSVLEAIREDYVRTASAKGLSQRIVLIRHTLRPSLVPIITLFGLQVGAVIGGSVIIENVFNLPGIGRLLVDSINRKDYQVVQTLVFGLGMLIVAINLLTDLLYVAIDPRVRLGGG